MPQGMLINLYICACWANKAIGQVVKECLDWLEFFHFSPFYKLCASAMQRLGVFCQYFIYHLNVTTLKLKKSFVLKKKLKFSTQLAGPNINKKVSQF
jgi:hypothetical protein